MKLVGLITALFLCSVIGLTPYDVSRVTVARLSIDAGNGLVAKTPIKHNDIILSVPLATCICSHRCGAIRGLAGQTDFSFDLFGDLRECVSEEEEGRGRTWDINLAIALIMATCGENLAASGAFWDSYRGAFPSPESVTVPFFLSQSMLDELQDERLKVNALSQRSRVQSIVTNANAPAPEGFEQALLWAFAMVRSRCFQVSDDWFAMVPIVDIANHDAVPSAKFEIVTPSNAQIPATQSEEEAEEALFATGVCVLRATRDLAEGDPVTISYGGSDSDNGGGAYSNERLLVQYGFTIDGNPTISEDIFPPLSLAEQAAYATYTVSDRAQDALVDAAAKLFADGGGLVQRVQSIAPLLGRQVRSMPVDVLLEKVRARLAAFPTTLASDYELCQQEELIRSQDSNQGSGRDSRKLTCLRYRIDMKENLTVAELILKYAAELLN